MKKGDKFGKNIGFSRIRRITGYLSPVSKWNNAKRKELYDRKKNVLNKCESISKIT